MRAALSIGHALYRIGQACSLCADQVEGETTTAWKKRRRARKAYLEARAGEVLSDKRADEMWEDLLRQMSVRRVPTGLRAQKSVEVKAYALGVRLSEALPAGLRQLFAKGILTEAEMRMAETFRADYDLAYYSSPGLTVNYEAVGGGGGGVPAARAAVADARVRMVAAEAAMTARCWDVLVKMVVLDVASISVGADVSRYKDAKAQRYAAGILLIEALEALKKIYD